MSCGIEHIRRDCAQGYSLNTELGHGEQGVAYAVGPHQVLKTTPFKPSVRTHASKVTANANNWAAEACITEYMGTLGIGPHIFRKWVCDNTGYLIMQRMKTDLRHMIGEKRGGNVIDHIGLCPLPIQQDYVRLLERMIDSGYIHMDNHPGNLGITTGLDGVDHGMLFDFGFTIRRSWVSPADKLYALGFSLGQIIEHTPLAEVRDSYIFNLIMSIAQGTYVWGSLTPGAVRIRSFYAEFDSPSNTSALSIPNGVSRDMYLGFRMYCRILRKEVDERYEMPNLDKVYAIRQSKPFALGGKKTRRRKQTRTRRI